ncbi:hypothetical protein EON77_05595, partial [bacterium]
MRSPRLGLALLAALVTSAGTLAGCGGAEFPGTASGSTSGNSEATVFPATGRGRVALRVAWPTSGKTRVVPTATGSIRVDVRQGATVVATTVVVSPATTATLEDVPVGAFTVRATAYANATGTGTALARGELPAVVTDGGVATVPVTMASTVNSLTATPSSVSLLLGLLGAPTISVTARDADNNVVLLAAGDLEFTSSNPLVVTVSVLGQLTGLLTG